MANSKSKALLRPSAPLCTERYNGQQQSTTSISCTALYQTVQWPTSATQICYHLLYRFVPNGTIAQNYTTALLGSPVPLCTELYNDQQQKYSTAMICSTVMYRKIKWLSEQHCLYLLYPFITNGTMANSKSTALLGSAVHHVPKVTMAHRNSTALLGSVVPPCIERYNGQSHITALLRSAQPLCTESYNGP
jgi:hypothetical protein